MKKTLQEKERCLGMPFGTANAILRKSILFSLAHMSGMGACFRCGILIENENDFSIEHKKPYMYEENAKELFFSLDNIAFSHLQCNIRSIRRKQPSHGKSQMYRNGCKCEKCKEYARIHMQRYRAKIKSKVL